MDKLKYISPMLLMDIGEGGDVIDDPPSQGDNPLNSKIPDVVEVEMNDD